MKRRVELDIVSLAYTGQSVGYINGKVTFVNGGLPGERVEAVITKSKKSFNQATLAQVLAKSPERIKPVCPHYDICGGCTWQDLDYQRQLLYKHQQVVDCLSHIGGFENLAIDAIHPSPDTFWYRNKMEFSFHVVPVHRSIRGFVLGLHHRGRFDHIFDVHECHLQSPESNRLVIWLRDAVERLSLPVYDLVNHEGFLRFAVIREGKQTGQRMLILVSGEGEFIHKETLTEQLLDAFPDLTTAVWMVNRQKANIARGELQEIFFGPGYIEDSILGRRFCIAPLSFFQTNTVQAEQLYRQALDLAEISTSDHLLDLYCGSGAIGLCAADRVASITGIEIDPDAIASARLNAERNGIANASFFAGAVHKVIASGVLPQERFDPIIVDPPRAGLEPKTVELLLTFDSTRLIYISCNPATFARDARLLANGGYHLCRVVPFDMFPHTMHIELVSLFQKTV